jgi:hypothetical protein
MFFFLIQRDQISTRWNSNINQKLSEKISNKYENEISLCTI